MNKDKRVDPTDLPQPQTKLTATQQGEEYIDKSSRKKDDDDQPGRQSADSNQDNEPPQQGNRNSED